MIKNSTIKHVDIPPGKKVTINDNEEVVVGMDTNENFSSVGFMAVNDSAFKCPDCKVVTVHQGWEAAAIPVQTTIKIEDVKYKRIYLCTNCGKFSSK